METQIVVAFIIAFVAGLTGSEVGHRWKRIQRGRMLRAALGTLIGFMSATVTLLLLSRASVHPLAVAVPVGLLFGYLMSDAKAFERME